jgi:FkbM family methyltransferase
MLFSVSELGQNFNVHPNGVLHVGAHKAEESLEYQKHGWGNVVWVEAQPDLVIDLVNRLSASENTVIEAAVWDESGIKLEFNVASNGESSSLLEFGSHAESYPQIKYESSIVVFTKRLDEIIPIGQFADFLNVDVQGVELKALQGLGSRIKEFKWVYTEVNKSEVYKDCTLIGDLDDYLGEQGFKRISTRWVFGKGWGDALYRNQNMDLTQFKKGKIALGDVRWISRQILWQVKSIFRTLIVKISK